MHRVWGLVLPRPVEDWSPGLDSAGDSVSAVRRRQAAGRLGTSEKEQRPSSLTVGDVQKVCVCLYLSCRAIALSLALSRSLSLSRARSPSFPLVPPLTHPANRAGIRRRDDRPRPQAGGGRAALVRAAGAIARRLWALLSGTRPLYDNLIYTHRVHARMHAQISALTLSGDCLVLQALRHGAVRRFESTGALLLVRFVRTC